MNWLQPRIMSTSLRIHPIVVLGSVLVGLKVAGIPGAIFGIPIAAVISALFLHVAHRGSAATGPSPSAPPRASAQREGRADPPAARAEPADRPRRRAPRRRATRRRSARRLGRAAAYAAPRPQVLEDLAGGVLAGAAGDAAAGMGAGAAQVQPLQRDSVAGVAEQRPPDEELVEARLGVERVAAGEPVVAARGPPA